VVAVALPPPEAERKMIPPLGGGAESLTVTEMVAGAEESEPSETWKLKESEPA
jgi:hypothetical protein